MFNILNNLSSLMSARSSSSFLGASISIFKYIWAGINSTVIPWFIDAFTQLIWTIVKLIFGAMELFEYIIKSFLGIGSSVNDMYQFITSSNQKFLDVVVHTFRAILAVSIVLVIIFTIYAIIKQEWNNSFTDKGASGSNSKKGIILKAFRNLIVMLMLPLTMLFLISAVNSILTAFSNALKGNSNVTVAGQVLATSTYDSNRYRTYADNDKRIPIIISAYNVDDYGSDQNNALVENIKSVKVQKKLLNTADLFANGKFLSIKNSLQYKNNTLVNSANYGDYYENFICTAEQYQVMADFIDYAQLNNLNFYIKAIDEKDVDWRYVDSSVFDSTTNTLTISYRDASDLDDDNRTDDIYTITYKMSYNVTSPISDALKSIMALLGVGEDYEDNLFKVMERQDDSTNLVNWANEKVLLQLSEDFDYNDMSTWTDTDQIIMYEYYHYEIDNNDLGKYEIEDLKNGVEFDAYQIVTRRFVDGLYTGDDVTNCVFINDSYYRVELSDTLVDSYGNKYYVLSSIDGGYFLENSYTTIEKVENDGENVTSRLELSEDFDIHDTSTWTFGDQIIVYEYYRYSSNVGESGGILGQGADSSLRRYYFSQYLYKEKDKTAPQFNVYKISKFTRNGINDKYAQMSSDYYVKLNNTFYQVDNTNNYKLFEGSSREKNFISLSGEPASIFYIYTVKNSKFSESSGLEPDSTGSIEFDQKFIYSGIDSSYFNTHYEEFLQSKGLSQEELERLASVYDGFAYKLSGNFKFNDISTWTYRDYLIFYMYLTYRDFSDGYDISALKTIGVKGNVGYISNESPVHAGEMVYQVMYRNRSGGLDYLYLPIDKVSKISEALMTSEINVSDTYDSNITQVGKDLIRFGNNNYDIYSEKTQTETLYLSDDFDNALYDTWTVGDLILFGLSSEGIIQSLVSLESTGYTALIYDIGGDRVYRLGYQDSAIYVSDSNVRKMTDIFGGSLNINSFKEWFEMPLIDFVCEKYDIDKNALFTNFDGIIGDLYNNYSSSVLTAEEVIRNLISSKFSIFSADRFDITTSIETYQYESKANFEDLDTWNYLDLAIYYLYPEFNGSVSVIKYNGDRYIVVGDYCIKIDDLVTLDSDYKITSAKYNGTDYQSLVYTEETLGTVVNTNNLYLYVNEKFSYTNIDGQNILDAVINYCYRQEGITTGVPTDFEFNIYTSASGIYKYLKLTIGEKDYYIALSTNGIYFENNSVLNLNGSLLDSKPLANSGSTYQSFVSGKYKFMDAVIYKVLGKKLSGIYTIYTHSIGTSQYKYIVVGDKIIQFYDSFNVEYNSSADFIAAVASKFSTDIYSSLAYRIYHDAYRGLYKSRISSIAGSAKRASLSVSFDINDFRTWSPIEIILFENGLIAKAEEESDAQSDLIEVEFDDLYIYTDIYNHQYLEIRSDAYIMIDDICSYSMIGTGLNEVAVISNGNIENDDAILKMYLNIVLTASPENSGTISSASEILSQNNNFTNNFDTFIGFISNITYSGRRFIDENVIEFENAQTEKTNSSMHISSPTTWNNFGMIYFYLTNQSLLRADKFYIYVDGNGNEYTNVIKTYGGTLILYVKDIQDDSYVQFEEDVNVEYTGNFDDLTPLTIIVHNLTSQTSISMYKYADEKLFYFFETNNGDYVGLFDVSDDKLDFVYTEETFRYELDNTSSNQSDALSWTIFDYLMIYSRGNSDYINISSRLYYTGGQYYFMVSSASDYTKGSYINVTKFLNTEKIHYDSTEGAIIVNGGSRNFSNYIHNDQTLNFLRDVSLSNFSAEEYWKVKVDTLTHKQLSDGFVLSDPSTWTLGDFVIYYMFKQGGYFDGITNFQEIVNNGFYVIQGYVTTQDRFGNVACYSVFSLSSNFDNYKKHKYYLFLDMYDVFSGTSLSSYKTEKNSDINITYEVKGEGISGNTPYNFAYEEKSAGSNFNFNEYYYFVKNDELWKKFDEDGNSITSFMDGTITSEFAAAILNGKANDIAGVYEGKHNLRLSEGFNINDPDTWTINDVIILVEYARAIPNNIFDTADFRALSSTDNTVPLFKNGEYGGFIVNGTVYSFYYTSLVDGKIYDVNTLLLDVLDINGNGTIDENENPLRAADDGASNITIFYRTLEFNLFSGTAKTHVISNAYRPHEQDGKEIYITLDSNMYINYQIILSLLNVNTITPIVREVNWPQKLMNDIQVLYPDLNWNTLLATQGWLDTLGEYHSAYTSGTILSDGNSSNITAAGIVLSEFFLSIATETEGVNNADFNYSSIFDEDTIKALMLAMLGEYEYQSLVLQGRMFMEMFNSMMAPVLDDIASETGFNIKDGYTENLKMCVYKSFLTTVLLGSDMGEYFYKIATRVYAQYTIYESLAIASGDYATYYAYINGLKDENGKEVDSFMYSTFEELVKYENIGAGIVSPTYTFNYNNAFQRYKSEIAGAEDLVKDTNFKYFDEVLSKLDKEYERIYLSGSSDPESSSVSENSPIYCFMLDAYWEIVKSVGGKSRCPVYATLYHNYIMGTVKRWGQVNSTSISNTQSSIKNYYSYKVQLQFIKYAFIMPGYIKMYLPDSIKDFPEFNSNTDPDKFEKDMKDALNKALEEGIDIVGPYDLLKEVFSTGTYKKTFENTFKDSSIEGLIEVFDDILRKTSSSENGNTSDWQYLKNMSNNLGLLLNELSEVMTISTGARTLNGSIKAAGYLDSYYENVFNKLQALRSALQTYISTQEKLDAIAKASITFTLAQYGSNYVPDGYKINIGNRVFTLTTSISVKRLAEYVMGGKFLENYGIPAEFTSPDFEGFVTTSKVYDSGDGLVKTKLNVWEGLRTFASKLADYTARLYYLSNLNDLSSNVSDAVLLTDYIGIRGHSGEITIEQMIINYLMNTENTQISADTFINLLYMDTSESIQNIFATGDLNREDFKLITDLAAYRTGASVENFTEEVKMQAIVAYVNFVASPYYTSAGLYTGNRVSDRVHEMFKNLISYLLINEEAEGEAKTIDLDNLTMKEFRIMLMKRIVDYKQNPSESAEQNSARYLALFNLINSQVNYYYLDSANNNSQVRIGTTIGNVYLYKDTNGRVYYKIGEQKIYDVVAEFSIDKATKDMIIELAGIPNRPIESLVNLEYNELYDMHGNYDEALGDTFVICYYDDYTGKYVPYLATGSESKPFGADSLYRRYRENYNFNIKTKYYAAENNAAVAYPIVAKGIMTEAGKPTAIKIEDYKVKFYRYDVTATFAVDDGAVNATRYTTETNTVKFVDYVDVTSTSNGKSPNNRARYIGTSDLAYFVNSDLNPYYIQISTSYNIGDEYGKISVLETIQAFYTLNAMTYMLIALGIAVIMPILFKGTMSVMRRILDLIFLTLIGPVAIATSTLNYDEESGGSAAAGKVFSQWKTFVTQTLLFVFGYIIAFNFYYILTSTVQNMTFVSAETMQNIQNIGGLKFATSSKINAIIRFLFLVIAAGTIRTSADMFVNIVTSGKATKAFETPMGGDVQAAVKGVVDTVKKTATGVKDIVSLKAVMDVGKTALEFGKNMIPGGAIIGEGIEAYKKHKTKNEAKELAQMASAAGVSKDVANALGESYEKQVNEQRKAKKERRQKDVKAFAEKHGMGELFKETDAEKRLRAKREEKEKEKQKEEAKRQKRQKKRKKKSEKRKKKAAKKK